MHSGNQHLSIEFDAALIRRLDRNGPRYTSYPTADHFNEAFTADEYALWVARRNVRGVHRPLSLYVHLPFCRSLCYYCACNKVITQNRNKSRRYLDHLKCEIGMQATLFQADPRVERMHWGGGSPTFYSTAEIEELFAHLRASFQFSHTGENSIEIDPRTVKPATIHELHALGFNRVSFGVQDFEPSVQRAIHRIQTEEQSAAVVQAARDVGFKSINIDLIYGLPRQSVLSFNRTLARVVALRPDRLAIYNYAHLPNRFKAQRLIEVREIPTADLKLKLLGLAVQRLTAAGYVYIGMDHFARPDDELALAQRGGQLQRNFQGYSTGAGADLVGLGVSAIGAVGPTYSQNARTLGEYYERIERGELPIARGIELTPDDLLRRSVIETLMCHFAISKKAVEIGYLVEFDRYFARELAQLADLQVHGLLEIDDEWITVTAKGRMLIRSICMVFDKYLRQERAPARYSRAI